MRGFPIIAVGGLIMAAAGLCGCALFNGPPSVDSDCREQLRAAGVRFSAWNPRPGRIDGEPVCVVPKGVAFRRGVSGMRYGRTVRVNCGFAMRLVRFEKIAQQEALRAFGQRIARVEHMGTYACRRMAKWPRLVSQHSYANALDVSAVVLKSGRRSSVLRDYPRNGKRRRGAAGKFWGRLTRRLYDEHVFSVVLRPNHDRLHRDHLHLDGSPFRKDGT